MLICLACTYRTCSSNLQEQRKQGNAEIGLESKTRSSDVTKR